MMPTLFHFKLWENNKRYWLREISSDEKKAFNSFLIHSDLGNIFQSYEWGQFKKLNGWQPIYLLLENNDTILGAATILKRNTASMTIFYSPRGPVLDYNEPHILSLFCRGAVPLARQQKAVFWRMDPELPRSFSTRAFSKAGLRPVPLTNPFGGIQPKWVWRVPLLKNSDKQWDLLKKGGRRQIKLSYKNKIKVREGSRQDLPVFYELLNATAEKNGFLLRNFNYYEDLWDQLAPSGHLRLLLAFYNEKPVSTALAVGFGQGVWDIYAGNNHYARETGASYLLTWKLIYWASKKGYAFYDLGGIVPQAAEDNPLGGLKLFKSRFGGEEVEFIGEYDLIFSPIYYRFWHWGQQSFQLLNRFRKIVKHKLR